MEESKELQKLYGFMQAFIYVSICVEVLLFVHFQFSSNIMPVLSKLGRIPIYSNIIYSKLFTFFIIMVTCIGTRSKKDLELDPIKQIVMPRQIAMYLSRELTDSSLPKIGNEFGGKDHTTVLHAIDKIEAELKKDTDLQNDITKLKAKLRS